MRTHRIPCRRVAPAALFVRLAVCAAAAQTATKPASVAPDGIPPEARYACPMETHPDRSDPAERGAYFSAAPGRCPWCGMALRPLGELEWVAVRRAAAGGEVAYTCPDHPHVFSEGPAACPRCGRALEPFRVMYTCPDPQHAHEIAARPGRCPECGRALVRWRGVWLSPQMAVHNVPPRPEVAQQAPYRCPMHPLVHSFRPARCTICAGPLEPVRSATTQPATAPAPPAALERYACPMESCAYLAERPGRCPKCGMALRPAAQVPWAQARLGQSAGPAQQYACPMHPDQSAAGPQTCPLCGMQLVPRDRIPKPADIPAALRTHMDYIMEHYLALHERLAADRTDEVALHARGLREAATQLAGYLRAHPAESDAELRAAAAELVAQADALRGEDLDADRVHFAPLGAALRALVARIRPDPQRYPRIYVFHCPMTKGDWLQTAPELRNPFYGHAMLRCGRLEAQY